MVITHFLDLIRATKSLCDTTPSTKYASGPVYLCTPDGVILPLFKCRITSIVNAKAECKRYKYGTIQKANDVHYSHVCKVLFFGSNYIHSQSYLPINVW